MTSFEMISQISLNLTALPLCSYNDTYCGYWFGAASIRLVVFDALEQTDWPQVKSMGVNVR